MKGLTPREHLVLYKDGQYNTFPSAIKKTDGGGYLVGFRQAPDMAAFMLIAAGCGNDKGNEQAKSEAEKQAPATQPQPVQLTMLEVSQRKSLRKRMVQPSRRSFRISRSTITCSVRRMTLAREKCRWRALLPPGRRSTSWPSGYPT